MSQLTYRYFIRAIVKGPLGLKRCYFAIDSTMRSMDSGSVSRRFSKEYCRFHGLDSVDAIVVAIDEQLIESDHIEITCRGMPLVPVA